jgi:hypothetical protein
MSTAALRYQPQLGDVRMAVHARQLAGKRDRLCPVLRQGAGAVRPEHPVVVRDEQRADAEEERDPDDEQRRQA